MMKKMLASGLLGTFLLLAHLQSRRKVELGDEIFSEDALSEDLRIEDILHRAHQIHHARGGLIGYDLEDWLQAEREWIGEMSQPISGSKSGVSESRSLKIPIPDFKRREIGEPS